MFQQPRNLHPMESMDFLMHQKISERMLSSHQQMQPPPNLESGGSGSNNKRTRVDQSVGGCYDNPSMVNFYPVADPSTSSVVLTRTEYEAMRQEIVVLKRTLAEFRGTVDTEIDMLKKENKLLKRQISRCTCSCRVHATSHATVAANDKLSENDGDILGGSFDKRLGESENIDLSNGASNGLIDLFERDNKSLQHRNRDLEKQLHMLRASSSRVPPLPTSEAVSFMRELMAYYSLLESSPGSSSSGGAAASSPSVADPTDLKDSYVSLLSLDSHQDRLSSVSGAVGYAMGFDAHSGSSLFANGLGSSCQLYGSLPEVFDAEKGLQVQLIPNYNVWVSKSKVQFIIKEAASQKDGAPLFVLRRLIPLVFSWEELAASRGQGLNCKSTDDVVNKEPLDPTKVLVCKAFMRKFCMENGHLEPLEKSVNETFSHQVNYARRKFKARTPKPSDGSGSTGASVASHHGDSTADHHDSFSQSQCIDGSGQ